MRHCRRLTTGRLVGLALLAPGIADAACAWGLWRRTVHRASARPAALLWGTAAPCGHRLTGRLAAAVLMTASLAQYFPVGVDPRGR